MTIETFLGITGLVFVVICQLVMRWCQNNTYIKGKYDRGRYIKIGGKR